MDQPSEAISSMPQQIIEAGEGATIRDVVQAVISGQVAGDVHIGNKVYTQSNLEELNDYLARAVAAFESRVYQYLRPAGPPDQPYKFLYAFEIEDVNIFFGRDTASEALYKTILKDRLTVLHAKSGAGKTSLLKAGLSPRLIRDGRLPLYARAYEDPVLAIKRAIAPPSVGPWPELLLKLTLYEFIGLVCSHLGRQTQELIIMLDQFEEFFIFWSEQDHRKPFIDILGNCYDDKSLPIRIIIALRKDYFSDLVYFQERIPNIFYNEYHLATMSREEAQLAIIGPLIKLDQPVDYEQALLDTLLNDLVRHEVELPHLQIVCTQLYERLAEGEVVIALSSYERLGRVEGVLGRYLYWVLDELPGKGATIAKDVLKELVSSKATKRVLSYATLGARVEAKGEELDSVLAWLINARLLRRDELAGDIFYEMAHEYLIGEVHKWINQSELAFKQAEDMLQREVANWGIHGTLIPKDRLEMLHVHRQHFKGLNAETREYILRSALQEGFAIEDWSEVAGEYGEKLLLTALNNKRGAVRHATIRGLGIIWRFPEVCQLGDKNWRVRMLAAKKLGQLGDLRAVKPLITALRDRAEPVREAAAEALGELGDLRAVKPLTSLLWERGWDSSVSSAAAKALGKIGDPRAAKQLIAALKEESEDVRLIAAEVLGELGDPRAVNPLIAALQDAYEEVRFEAARALGRLGDPRAVNQLIIALEDESEDVRLVAAEALGKLGDFLAVEPLIVALLGSEGYVRGAAAEALGKLGDSRAVGPLTAALQHRDANTYEAVVWALKKIGTPKALAALGKSGHK